MGCGGSKEEEATGSSEPQDPEADLKSKQLEQELEKQQAEENAIVKLLVLGTGESGKSTVFKQMKILYSVPDPPAKFIMICRANLFGNAHTVMDGMEKLGIEFADPAAKEAGEKIKKVPPDGNADNISQYIEPLLLMYADGGVKEAIERANEFQLNDSTIYFWDRAAELCKSDYLPSDQDVLRARVRAASHARGDFACAHAHAPRGRRTGGGAHACGESHPRAVTPPPPEALEGRSDRFPTTLRRTDCAASVCRRCAPRASCSRISKSASRSTRCSTWAASATSVASGSTASTT
jgi:hypothetical protein